MSRLGQFDPDKKVKKYPTEFATGGRYNRQDDPTAIRIKYGDTPYFYVLPSGGRLTLTDAEQTKLSEEYATYEQPPAAPVPEAPKSGRKAGGPVVTSEEAKPDA